MCKTNTLALSGPFRIEGCAECGNLSIHLGPITVRGDRASLKSLHRICEEALGALDAAPKLPLEVQAIPRDKFN